ncbi:hypothetical protein PT286_08630 [Neisseriaceae bacterium ESL0693]|nr:hypothetical protein [Neisseriaceae bacterium ESL0693]
MNTYTVDYSLLATCADALQITEQFSQYVEIIAEVMQLIALQSLPDQDFLLKRLADMLIQMATHVQNCESGRLAANLCTVFDGGEEIKQ